MVNPYINWVDIDQPDDRKQAQVIATMFDKNVEELDEDVVERHNMTI